MINLNSLDDDDIAVSCKNMISKYANDLNEYQLITESEIAKNDFTFDKFGHEYMYKTIFNDNLAHPFQIWTFYYAYICVCLLQWKMAVWTVYRFLLLNELNCNGIIDKFVDFKYRKGVIQLWNKWRNIFCIRIFFSFFCLFWVVFCCDCWFFFSEVLEALWIWMEFTLIIRLCVCTISISSVISLRDEI